MAYAPVARLERGQSGRSPVAERVDVTLTGLAFTRDGYLVMAAMNRVLIVNYAS